MSPLEHLSYSRYDGTLKFANDGANIIDNILTKPICKNCEENETKDMKTNYCDWCGYNIYHIKGVRQ